MPPIIAGGIARFTLSGMFGSRAWANVFDMHIDTQGLADRDDACPDQAKVFLNEWIDHMKPVLSAAVTLERCRWLDMDSSGGSVGEATVATAPRVMPSAGNTGATGTAPANVAVLVKKQTNGGRNARNGRTYWPGIGEGSIDISDLTSAYKSSFQTAVNDFLSGINQSGSTSLGGYDSHLVVVHLVGGLYQGHSDVNALTVQSRVATQRRRLRA